MKKKIIAVAVAACLALPIFSAHAVDVADKKLEVYGKVHVNFGSYDKDGTAKDNWLLKSNASRLGFKGKQKLDEGLSATYKFEWQVDATENKATGLEGRNMYAGLKGGFGEVRLGRHDSPLKMAQGKFDQFGDTEGDLKHAGDQDGENRNNNTITYLGKFDNVGVNAQFIPGEGDGTTAGDGPADTISAAVTYKSGPMYIGLGHDAYDNKGSASEASLTRLVATYKFSDMQIGALYQTGVEKPLAASKKEDWVGLSFNMKMGTKNKLKAQYLTVKDSATSVNKSTLLAVGIDRKLGKKGSVYVMYSSLDALAKANDSSSVSVGYVVKF